MEKEERLRQTIAPLLAWYRENARELPWRDSRDPYHVWVSEIMLQQTRVETVKPYYERFLRTLPSVAALAEAEESLLLKLWEGLGYYSRVRNMQKAARQVLAEHNGIIPSDYASLLKLAGVGSYTAGAIASIAFSKPCAAVDGNVLRVMARLTADWADISRPAVKKEWEAEISAVLPRNCPGEYNQALMELGATVCLPNGTPRCGICPLRALCQAYRNEQTALFPIRRGKKDRTLVEITVFFLISDGRIALHKRPTKGLLSNLWELPNCPKEVLPFSFLQEQGVTRAELFPMARQKHIFTHVEWHMDCYLGNVLEKQSSSLVWVLPKDVETQYALPSAFKKTWREGLERIGEG